MNKQEMERAIKAIANVTDYTLGEGGRRKAYIWIGDLARAVERGDREEQVRLYAMASRYPGEF